MRIGIFAPPVSRQARRLAAHVEALAPGAARLFPLDLAGGVPAVVGDDGLRWDGQPVDGLAAAVVMGFSYQDPVVPDVGDGRDWSLWQAGYPAEQQRYSMLYSFLCRLAAAGVTVLSGADAHLLAFQKPTLLRRLGLAGVAVPDWLCSSDPQAVDDFLGRHPQVLWRNTTGRCAWQLFTGRQRAALIAPGKPPVLLAASVAGPLRRAYLVAGRAVLTLGHQAPDAEGLERLEVFGNGEDAAAAPMLARVAEAAATPWGVVQYVPGPSGPVIFDLDPDPVLDELPPVHADMALAGLAAALAGAAAPGLATADAERPALFLRRMLRILFDMEATKYADA